MISVLTLSVVDRDLVPSRIKPKTIKLSSVASSLRAYRSLKVYQRSYSQVGYIPPKMSDSLQRNVRQIWESTPSNYRVFGRTSWVHSEYLVRRESGYLKIFFYISQGEHVKHFVIDVYCIRAKKGSSKVNICHARAQQTFDA